MFTLTTTTTSYLRQVTKVTSASLEVDFQLALECRYAHGHRHYVIVTQF